MNAFGWWDYGTVLYFLTLLHTVQMFSEEPEFKICSGKHRLKGREIFELHTLEESVFALDVLFQKNSERRPVKVVKCQLERFTQLKKKPSLAVRSLRADTVSSSSENSLFRINLSVRVCRGPSGERPYPGRGGRGGAWGDYDIVL